MIHSCVFVIDQPYPAVWREQDIGREKIVVAQRGEPFGPGNRRLDPGCQVNQRCGFAMTTPQPPGVVTMATHDLENGELMNDRRM